MPRWVRLLIVVAVIASSAYGVDVALRTYVGPRPAGGTATVAYAPAGDLGGPLFVKEFIESVRADRFAQTPVTGVFLPGSSAWVATVQGGRGASVGDERTGKTRLGIHSDRGVGIRASPFIDAGVAAQCAAHGLVLIPSASGVTAVDDRSLGITWEAPSPARATHVLAPGRAIVVASKKQLAGLDPATGGVRWALDLVGEMVAEPVAVDAHVPRVVIVDRPVDQTRAQMLLAVDAETGAVAWRADVVRAATIVLAAGGGYVVQAMPASDAHDQLDVTLREAGSGAVRWVMRLPGYDVRLYVRPVPPPARLAVDGGQILVASGESLHALDLGTGSRRWSWAFEPGPLSPGHDRPERPPFRFGGLLGVPMGHAGRVYVAIPGGVLAVDAATGREAWRFLDDVSHRAPRPVEHAAPPVVRGPTLYVPANHLLFVLRPPELQGAAGAPPAPTGQLVPTSALWGTGGAVVALATVALALRRPRALLAGSCAVLLAVTALWWFDGFAATRFAGVIGLTSRGSHTAEARAGVTSERGRLSIGRSNAVWHDVTRGPLVGDANAAVWLTRAPLPAELSAQSPWGWLSSAHSSGTELGDQSVRAVVVPHWPLAALFALAPLAWLGGWRDRRRYPAGHCRGCGYDLRATPGRCPECGHEEG
ncbi:MAG: PQQ-binding-like beta-propeller repeat protein [Phycisphaerae bacterium]|nr:PQQ-binding-like beta-propeller repeat protein [Tepidisphaeraceae bacterium]